MSEARAVTRWPLDTNVRTVAIVGGTFDPPHRAHLAIARSATEALGSGSGVVFVPAAVSPFKVGVAQTAAEHRLAMVRLAVAGETRWGVWSDEIDRAREGVPSYMVDTLERAAVATGGSVAMRLVMGADQALRFHGWREFRRVLGMAAPLVLLRAPLGTVGELRAGLEATGAWSGAELDAWCGWCVDAPLDAVSSTAVRDAVRGGVERARGMVDDRVLAYIGAHGLYR